MKSEQQYNSIDLVKFIMSVVVIAIHTCPLIDCNSNIILGIYNILAAASVPFFFIAAGFLLSKKLTFTYVEKDIGILKKYLYKIFKLYITWMVIYTPLSIYHSITVGDSFIRALLIYIKGLIFTGEQYNSWPLWYLLSTLYAVIVIIFAVKRNNALTSMVVISILFLIVSICIDWFVKQSVSMPYILVLIQKLIRLSIADGRIFRGLIYIPMGIYLAHKPAGSFTNWILLLMGVLLKYFVNNVLGSIILAAMMMGLFGVVVNVKLKNNKIYLLLRNMSTIIYFIHMYVWSVYYKVVYNKKTYGWDSFLVTTIVSVIIAFIYLKAMQAIRKSNAGAAV